MTKRISLLSFVALTIGLLVSCQKSDPTFTVSFDTNGHGSNPASITGVASGSTIAKPADPAADGFIFGGWFKEEACVNAWDFATDKVVADITLYAGWTKAVTIGDILPEGFPAVGPEGQDPAEGAWLSIAAGLQCYLSADGSKLVFYNAAGTPDKLYGISTNEVVTEDNDSYVCTVGSTTTITFTMSEGSLLNIRFENTADQTWNGTYEQSACVAAGTMITLENGTLKAVEELEVGDVIRTFDHETGELSSSQVCLIMGSEKAANAFTLNFEGGSGVTVIEEHGFFDWEEWKYVFINALNAKNYIGHHFYNADNGSWLELTGYKMYGSRIDAYAIITAKHLNHLSNGLLSMCDGSLKLLANLFEYDELMRFDAEKKDAAIDTFGLTPLEKVLEFEGFTESDYYNYNLQYLDIAVGKGLFSWEWVKALSDYCVANNIF